MSLKITHKYSTAAGTPPASGDIDVGEIAINAADAELYTKDNAGNIKKFANTDTTGTAASVQFTQSGTGAVQRTVESKLQDVVSVKDFGAVGDGVTDDTAAIQAAIDYVQTLIQGIFRSAGTVYLPTGTYKVTSGLTVSESNVGLTGESDAGVVILATSPTYDVLTFSKGGGTTLFRPSLKDIRILANGNASAGSLLVLRDCNWGTVDNVQLDGGYHQATFDGCGKVVVTNFLCHQTSRSSGTPSVQLRFMGTNGSNSDVHLTNWQIYTQPAARPNYAIRIVASDGIYFTSGHLHSGVEYDPNTNQCTGTFWSNVYFDDSPINNIVFSGTSTAYGNHWFSNCMFRKCARGLYTTTTSNVYDVLLSNCTFQQHTSQSIQQNNAGCKGWIIDNCRFKDNTSTTSIIDLKGENNIITGCLFTEGAAAATAVILRADSSKCMISNSSFRNCLCGTKLSNIGTNNSIGSTLDGHRLVYNGNAIITSGSTSVTVTHNLAQAPLLAQILASPTNPAAANSNWYLANPTATTFDIVTTLAVAGNANFSWRAQVSTF